MRRALLGVALAAVAWPAAATAAPPPNDNYLLSTRLDREGVWPREPVTDVVDTREATVQPDLFAPPRAGGGPEAVSCGGVRFGRTVWYDATARQSGTLEIRAAGYDNVIAAYLFDPRTTALRRSLTCQNEPGIEELYHLQMEKGESYTIQIGGVDAGQGAAAGLLQSSFEFFADRDRDGIYDELDRCPRRAGVNAAGGCPPRLRANPRLSWDRTGSGLRVRSLVVEGVARGSRVQARCRRGCSGRQTRTARRAGDVSLTRFRGRTLPPGARLEVRVTRPRDRNPESNWRYGAIGLYYRYDIRSGAAPRTTRCLLPGSSTPRRRCR